MRIYESPEITVEEVSVQDIVLASTNPTPKPTPTPGGGTGTPVMPFSVSGAEEVSGFGTDGGASVGDAFGNF